jgi:tetratricopeptide (TPR) repeat protein
VEHGAHFLILYYPQVASSLNNLGVVLEAMGRYEEALDALHQCHAIQLQLLAADHPDVAATLNNLGKVLHRAAQHEAAVDTLRQALRIRQRSFGPAHPKVAETLNILAVVLDDVGQYDEAEALCRAALAIRTAVVDAAATQGPEHQTAIQLELASSLGNLAALLQRKRQPLLALQHAQRALSIKSLFLGPNHPDVATAANNVGELLKLSGSPVEATQHYQHALRVWRTQLGPSHPHVAVALLNLGQLTQTVGNVEDAESYMLQGLAVFRDRLREPTALRCDIAAEEMDSERLPDCHPVLGALFNNLSLLYHHMGRLRPAVFCMERAVRVRGKLLGEEHPDTLNSYRRLASLRQRLVALEAAHGVSSVWSPGCPAPSSRSPPCAPATALPPLRTGL